MADNDYAVGQVAETIAGGRAAGSTLVFVVEDDAQNGADHVDARRSLALVAGVGVKQGALVGRGDEAQDFSVEDHLDTAHFNAALWAGLGDGPEPAARSGADRRAHRDALASATPTCRTQVGAR